MKKLMLILVMVMSVLVINAQTKTPAEKDSKAPVAKKAPVTETKAPVASTFKVSDLPKTVTDNIAKDYAGYTIKDASSITGKNGLEYKVAITKGTETENLLFDKDGKFVKKLEAKAQAHHDMKGHDKKK